MKNNMERLPKVNAQVVADRLSKNMGKPRAKSLAESNARLLSEIGPTDINRDLFSFKQVQKDSRFWKEVAAILSK